MLKLFEEQKYSLYKLAKLIGVNVNTLYKYTKGKDVRNMRTENMLNIAYHEKIEPNKLLKMMIDYQNKQK